LVPPTATPAPASIDGRVWKDDNGNGLDDDDELGVADLEVVLISKLDDMVMDSTTTNDDGSYSFVNLDPNMSYRVRVILPEDNRYTFTTSSQGDDDTIDSDVDPSTGITKEFIELTAGQSTEIDAGVRNAGASIGDFVWLDENQKVSQKPKSHSGSIPQATVSLMKFWPAR